MTKLRKQQMASKTKQGLRKRNMGPKSKLSKLMAEMGGKLPMVEGWDTLSSIGLEIEHAIRFDDGLDAKSHLAAGRSINYGDSRYPGQIIKEYPDGRKQLVDIDEKSVVTPLL